MVDFNSTKADMQKSADYFKSDIASIRTGRATPALIENISCNAYGGASKLAVKELGTIATMDSQTLVVQPYDASVIGEIRQGILAANVGLTPVIDNNLIRISVPALTAERRNEYIKILHQKMEQTKVSIRNIRQDKKKAIEDSLDDKEISEDDKYRFEEELQKITDEFIAKIEEISAKKEQEITSI